MGDPRAVSRPSAGPSKSKPDLILGSRLVDFAVKWSKMGAGNKEGSWGEDMGGQVDSFSGHPLLKLSA